VKLFVPAEKAAEAKQLIADSSRNDEIQKHKTAAINKWAIMILLGL
jgi:hypothetical protein